MERGGGERGGEERWRGERWRGEEETAYNLLTFRLGVNSQDVGHCIKSYSATMLFQLFEQFT